MHARCGALANSWACDSQCWTARGHGKKPLSAAATIKAVKQLIAIKQPAGRWDAGQGWAHRDTRCGRRCLWAPRSPTQQGAIVTRLGEPGPPFWPWRGPPRKVGPPKVSVADTGTSQHCLMRWSTRQKCTLTCASSRGHQVRRQADAKSGAARPWRARVFFQTFHEKGS